MVAGGPRNYANYTKYDIFCHIYDFTVCGGVDVLRISSALQNIIDSSSEFQFGFHNQLFNLTRLAEFIRPMVEARTKKTVQHNSLVMALSRLNRRRVSRARKLPRKFVVQSISVLSGLTVMTFARTPENHRAAERIYSRLRKAEAFCTMTEGSNEITFIFPRSFRGAVQPLLVNRPTFSRNDVAALCVRFHPKYLDVPGLLHTILQQITLQGINIIEIASTTTELTLYIREDDLRTGFDTLMAGLRE